MTSALLALACWSQGETAPTPTVSLLAENRTVKPGQPFRVVVAMAVPDGWHTYYANPGESGMPTRIAWTLPKGWKAGPIQWLPPKKIVIGGIPNFAYEGQTGFVTEITPARTAHVGATVTLAAKASWLLCQEACVPQSADVSTEVTVGKSPVPAGEGTPVKVLLNQLPQPLSPGSFKATAKGKSVVIQFLLPLKANEAVEFFPADPDFFAASTGVLSRAGNHFDVTTPLSQYASAPPKRITGVLRFSDGRKALWIDGPIQS